MSDEYVATETPPSVTKIKTVKKPITVPSVQYCRGKTQQTKGVQIAGPENILEERRKRYGTYQADSP